MSGKQLAFRYPRAPPAPGSHDADGDSGSGRAANPLTQERDDILIRTQESEPRRSVRATKGQHTKPFDQLDHPPDPPKKRQGKRGKKATPVDDKQEEPEDEVIRCVCGATEQDEDSGEAWIACDTCGAWQHNVCVGMSVFTEDVPNHYYCERCKPSMHQELLEGIEKGEKPWEARRAAHEAEEEAKKKKKGRKGGRGKRMSDQKDKEATPPVKGKTPPATEVKKEKKEPAKQTGKRKNRDESQDTTESKVSARPSPRHFAAANVDTGDYPCPETTEGF